jgi:hypothetical protein
VEYVIAVPTLLFTLVFAYEFGRAFFAYQVITSDVEAALRYITHSTDCVPVGGSVSGNDIVAAQNLAECATLPTQGNTPAACTAPHFPWNEATGATLTVTNALTDSTNFNATAYVVQVEAAVPITLSLLNYIGLGGTYTMTVADQARCVGS